MTSIDETTLYLLCGKIASGKSTCAKELSQRPSTVLIDMDQWMSILFPAENASVEDFVRLSARLRDAMQPLVVDILKSGTSVVLDFPANTVGWRIWMKGIISDAQVSHELHVFDVPDEVCKARLRHRNQSGDHACTVDETAFDLIGRHFVPPSPDEGFDVIVHRYQALPG
ncbi:MAG: ATP-binding protein [Paracoccaceae bacterium]